MHVGRENPQYNYTMDGEPISKVEVEKDIRVVITNNLKPTNHCIKAAQTGRQVLFQLIKTFYFRDRYIFKRLYIQYVRPHLEFVVPAWSPWMSKDIDLLEKVQEKFVRNLTGLIEKTYEE